MGNNQVVKQSLTTEKPKYYKSDSGDIVLWLSEGNGIFFEAKYIFGGSRLEGELINCNYAFYKPCDYTEPVEVSPETDYDGCGHEMDTLLVSPEEPSKVNTLLATIEQVRKQVIDLEQKNYELEAQLQNNWSEKETLNNALKRIAELEAQLAAKSEVLSNTEQLPVYDYDWLLSILIKHDHYYGFLFQIVDNGLFSPLLPQDSAPIILRALAKELDGVYKTNKDGNMYCIQEQNGELCVGLTYKHMKDAAHIFTSEIAAQKAIDILTTHFPVVLKNYFA